MKIYEYKIKRTLVNETKDSYIKNKNSAEIIARNLIDFGRNQEQFVAIFLDCTQNVKGTAVINIGCVDKSLVSVRSIIKIAILSDATSLIVAHNHPSGNLTPSDADKEITTAIKKAAALFDIELLEHLILSENNSTSII